MDVVLELVDGPADELRSLRAWLVTEDGLRGRVQPVERPPAVGELGADLTGLLIGLAGTSGSSALAAVLVTWIRTRHSDLDLLVRREDGVTTQIKARRLRHLDASALPDTIRRVTEVIVGLDKPAGGRHPADQGTADETRAPRGGDAGPPSAAP